MPDEEELIGEPIENVPEREPGQYCNARKSTDGLFKGYCRNESGWGTDNDGGRCKLHGGASPKGPDSPHFKHGLFSDYLSEQDREELEAIEAAGNVGNLQSVINYEFLRLRRAVRFLEDDRDEDASFWDAYQEVIEEASKTGLGSDEIGALAELLDSEYSSFNHRIEEIRKLVKTYEELNEGRKVNLSGDLKTEVVGEGGGPIQIEWRESTAEKENDTQ